MPPKGTDVMFIPVSGNCGVCDPSAPAWDRAVPGIWRCGFLAETEAQRGWVGFRDQAFQGCDLRAIRGHAPTLQQPDHGRKRLLFFAHAHFRHYLAQGLDSQLLKMEDAFLNAQEHGVCRGPVIFEWGRSSCTNREMSSAESIQRTCFLSRRCG